MVLDGTASSRLRALNPQPLLQPPAWTVSPQRRHPCQQAVVWMTWTSWGRPSSSSLCPPSPSKCGGEGTPWLAWGGSAPCPQNLQLLLGCPWPRPCPRPSRERPDVFPRAALQSTAMCHCPWLEGRSSDHSRRRIRPTGCDVSERRDCDPLTQPPLGLPAPGEDQKPRGLPLRRASVPWEVGRSKSCRFQGEETQARETGGLLSQPSGTARKPAFPVPLISWSPKIHLSMHRPSTREKQQPAPRLTLRDLQNKSSCSVPSSGASSRLHTVSPEPPGPLQQPTPTELSLANITVPLESIKPSSILPVTVYDQHGFRVLFHFARDPLPGRSDVLVVVVSMLSTAPQPIRNIVFQSAVPKVMKVKLQPPSGTELPAFNPIVHPSAITQVLLLANPQKEKVRLRYKLLFTMGDQTYNEMGDVDQFPPPETWGSL
ncbi:ADP-ribosylation factor-binding protein GGA1 [Camelus dromedarius]|uniref:ADP-ribosylation factor-binding protein GGA1 n=1 Tax=Camelus dromedarius TaxID=9838 RepID=A0A5N4DF52_CAMDR|nr:ADP-ribosylation factor-binding protein GGA1 [Camelus dromedarius]KAB1269736.1 ADP-ribosylation factor-binding protein GGA1 [Camelus dromedarius]